MSLLMRRGSGAGKRPKPSSTVDDMAVVPQTDPVSTQLWDAKYAPSSSQELAMHPQKIEEVRQWLKKADVSLQLGLPPTPRLLVLSGPPGSGKSAMLRVLAAEVGFETCEWVEPRATSQEDAEDVRTSDGGRQDPRAVAFTTFLRDSLRTLSLCVQPSWQGLGDASAPAPSDTGRRRLVILDDLASIAQGSGFGASDLRSHQMAVLSKSLGWARFPVALVLTSDSTNVVHNTVEELRAADSSHCLVSHIQVNALADTYMLRALQHICSQEGLSLSRTDLQATMSQSKGDLRNALHSLQFMCTGLKRTAPQAPTGTRKGAGNSKRPRKGAEAATALALPPGPDRDHFPDLFRAIGSILHRPAKRAKMQAESLEQAAVTPAGGGAEWSGGITSECHAGKAGGMSHPSKAPGENARAELDADFAPEDVIERSSLEEASAAAFLHQSYIECFSDISDLADAALCLSDANFFADAYRRRPWQIQLLPYVASFAGRGVITCNRTPVPSRRLQICKPQVFAMERDVQERKRRVSSIFQRPRGGTHCFYTSAELATDFLPMMPALMQFKTSLGRPQLGRLNDESMQAIQRFVGSQIDSDAHALGSLTSRVELDDIEEDT